MGPRRRHARVRRSPRSPRSSSTPGPAHHRRCRWPVRRSARSSAPSCSSRSTRSCSTTRARPGPASLTEANALASFMGLRRPAGHRPRRGHRPRLALGGVDRRRRAPRRGGLARTPRRRVRHPRPGAARGRGRPVPGAGLLVARHHHVLPGRGVQPHVLGGGPAARALRLRRRRRCGLARLDHRRHAHRARLGLAPGSAHARPSACSRARSSSRSLAFVLAWSFT